VRDLVFMNMFNLYSNNIIQYCDYVHLCRHTGRSIHAVNMGSYNYLGFANTSGPCADESAKATCNYGLGTCSSRHELGLPTLIQLILSVVFALIVLKIILSEM